MQPLGSESATECVVWAAKKANDREGDTGNEKDVADSDEESTLNGMEGSLKVEEKGAIRLLSLSSPLVQETEVLKESLARSHPDSLRHWQLQHMLREEDRKLFELRDRTKKRHQARKAALREKWVSVKSTLRTS